MFAGVPDDIRVWASHGDFVAAAPAGFDVVATSANAPVAAMQDGARRFYGRLGFAEIGRVPEYYGGVETAVRMARDIRRGTNAPIPDWRRLLRG